MRRAVALVATLAITAPLALAGCQGRIGDRLDRGSQSDGSAADPGAGTNGFHGSGTGRSGDSQVVSVDADLDAVDAMLREIDSTLAEDRRPPADAD